MHDYTDGPTLHAGLQLMLILTRRKGEQILIGDDVVITILGLGTHGEQRVGIEAPRDIPVVRSEIAWKLDEDGNRIEE